MAGRPVRCLQTIRNHQFLRYRWTRPADLLRYRRVCRHRRGEPLKIDGIYGQQTYATVLMFQFCNKLQETGTVDVVTLDKLEPMVPYVKWNSLLALVMKRVQEVP